MTQSSVSTYLGGIKLPVNPLEEVSFNVSGDNKTFSIVSLGEISELGNRKQISVSIKSLFVTSTNNFLTGNYTSQIIKMIDDKKPVQFIITGGGFDTNILVSIDSFKYDIPYGEGGDVYYSLSLKEYREHKAKSLVIKSLVNSTSRALTNSEDYIQKRGEVAANA